MSDVLHKTTGDPATPGYRPLPGSGPTRGADLRTTVYAGLGIALGIIAGTFIADGTVQRMLAGPRDQVAQVRPQAFPVAPSPSLAAVSATSAAVSTPQAIAAATPTAAVVIPAAEPSHDTTPTVMADTKPRIIKPVPPATPRQGTHAATQVASAQNAPVAAALNHASSRLDSSVKAEDVSAAARTVAVTHHHRSIRRSASRRVHLGRRHGRGRHRFHPLERIAMPVRSPAKIEFVGPEPADEPAGFTVEGNLTVLSIDPSEGIVQTYEGESFALGKPAGDTTMVAWLQNPADLHYRCDQSGNCTLGHGRVLVATAKRTK